MSATNATKLDTTTMLKAENQQKENHDPET